MAVITLITDFGASDEYVGVMKGVILGIDPLAAIVDLTHQTDLGDATSAAHMIISSYRFFPKGSIHVIVVDPGVGSERLIVAARYDGHIFIAPDNGIIPFIIKEEAAHSIVCLENEDFFLKPASHTFHGRDIFAPAAARISSGIPFDRAGSPVPLDALTRLPHEKPLIAENALTGKIVSTDHFGNIITNINSDTLDKFLMKNPGKDPLFAVGDQCIKGLHKYYSGVDANIPIALIGSRGFLEMAVNLGSAKDLFMVKKGDEVRVVAV